MCVCTQCSLFPIQYVSRREDKSKTAITCKNWGWKQVSLSALTPKTGEKTDMDFKPQFTLDRNNGVIWAPGHPKVGSVQHPARLRWMSQRYPGGNLTEKCGQSHRVLWEDLCPGYRFCPETRHSTQTSCLFLCPSVPSTHMYLQYILSWVPYLMSNI